MRPLPTMLGSGAAIAVLLLTAACAEQPEIGFGGNPPAPPERPKPPVPAKPIGERAPVAVNQVDAAALPESYPRKLWTQDGGKIVVAVGQEGGCSKVRAETTEQTPHHVRITLVEQTPEPPGPCTMDLRYPEVTSQLDQPLGERTVILSERSVKVPK